MEQKLLEQFEKTTPKLLICLLIGDNIISFRDTKNRFTLATGSVNGETGFAACVFSHLNKCLCRFLTEILYLKFIFLNII